MIFKKAKIFLPKTSNKKEEVYIRLDSELKPEVKDMLKCEGYQIQELKVSNGCVFSTLINW